MIVAGPGGTLVAHGWLRAPGADGKSRAPGALTTLTVGVLALQGDVREHVAALDRLGARTAEVRLPGDLAAVDALVLPGGESTTISRLLRLAELVEPLRQRLDGGMPCFATCAGLILLSRSILDGRPDQLSLGVLDVSVRRNAHGRQRESFETDLRLAALEGGPFRGVFIRAPMIEAVGEGIEVLGTHRGRAVGVARGASIGLAFHPEMTGDDRLHRLFLDRVLASAVDTAA